MKARIEISRSFQKFAGSRARVGVGVSVLFLKGDYRKQTERRSVMENKPKPKM